MNTIEGKIVGKVTGTLTVEIPFELINTAAPGEVDSLMLTTVIDKVLARLGNSKDIPLVWSSGSGHYFHGDIWLSQPQMDSITVIPPVMST